MIIRGKRPIPLFKLKKSNPPSAYCTRKVKQKFRIPRLAPVAEYLSHFSGLNNLKPSLFIINGREVIA